MTFFERVNSWARKSVTLKLLSIFILILILLIPSKMLQSLIHERQNIRNGAIAEVSSKWGAPQLVGGPVLSIPYKQRVQNSEGKIETEIRFAHFLPDLLSVSGSLSPEKRTRGIYVVVLYNAKLHVTGNFGKTDFNAVNIAPEDMLLKDAFIQIGISDMKGIKSGIQFRPKEENLVFNPGIVTSDIFGSGVSMPIDLTKTADLSFDFNLNINGSSSFQILPLGMVTSLELRSSWPNPSFEGSFLPDSREVNEQRFTSRWKVLQLNRNYPQQGLGKFLGDIGQASTSHDYATDAVTMDAVEYAYNNNDHDGGSPFGVRLMLPIDEYQKTLRSAKYDIVFIILTFVVFFFVEVLNKKRIHPIQYLMVGFAITLFYVLLLSISEHLTFNLAYLASCLCILLMVTLYSKAIFKSNFLTGLICAVLVILYGFFYSILQLQDYALLLGSAGLVLILGTIMYLTRNVDWYDVGGEKTNE